MRKRTYCKHLEACMDGVYCKEGHGGLFEHCIYFLEEHKCPYYESEIKMSKEIEELEKTINEEYADITDYKELVIKETAREFAIKLADKLKDNVNADNVDFFVKVKIIADEITKQFGVDMDEKGG